MKTCKCGKQLDSSATVCPGCGKKHASFLKKLAAAIIVGIAVLCFIAMNKTPDGTDAATPVAATRPATPSKPQTAAERRQSAQALRGRMISMRKAAAAKIDSTLLDGGIESTTLVAGPDDTTLIIEDALAGRVRAKQIGDSAIVAELQALGFKKLIYTNDEIDELAETFTWDLTK
ncbi:MAG: hypothetical protein ACRD4S_17060 [Candidatus Acidiferrales bacterium]